MAGITDRYHGNFVVGPYVDGFVVTPSNDALLQELPRALYVGTAGQVNIKFPNNTSVIPLIVPAGGVTIKVRPAFVMATGTTASTFIVALL